MLAALSWIKVARPERNSMNSTAEFTLAGIDGMLWQ